ncbi:unnamed protein product [Psylliodes chrysocephalus]|uniref:Uncharacterized protein n=1 Tax=Psylliodes chrysocephalus TaxID=3402493 RepID=A0A9P0G3H7_9CUCU|nr:unnamed protein product [Psylliodes chrysocephala]
MKFLVVLLCITGCSVARKLPSFIKVCKPKETDVSECILENIEIMRSKLAEKDGVPEMAIPSINPLVIPHANINLGEFQAQLENISLYRVQEFIIKKLKVDIDTVNIDLKIKFPKIDCLANYFVKGQLLVLKLDGSGPAQINITNLIANVVALGKKEMVNGKEHVVITSLDIKPEVGHLDLVLDNLFPKNSELTENANKLLNDNQNVIVEEFSPLVVNIIKEFLLSVLRNIFKYYSFDVLFPNA